MTEEELKEIEATWCFADTETDMRRLIAEVRRLRTIVDLQNRVHKAEEFLSAGAPTCTVHDIEELPRLLREDGELRRLRDWQARAIPELSTICAELAGQCLTPKGEDDLERITMLIDEALSELEGGK